MVLLGGFLLVGLGRLRVCLLRVRRIWLCRICGRLVSVRAFLRRPDGGDGVTGLCGHGGKCLLAPLLERLGRLLGITGELLRGAPCLGERRHLRPRQLHLRRRHDDDTIDGRLGLLSLRVHDEELPRQAHAGFEAELLGGDHRRQRRLGVGRAIGEPDSRERLRSAEAARVGADPDLQAVETPVVERAACERHVVRSLERERLGHVADDDHGGPIDRRHDLDRRVGKVAVAARAGKLERRAARMLDGHAPGPPPRATRTRRGLAAGGGDGVRVGRGVCGARLIGPQRERDRARRPIDRLLHGLLDALDPAGSIEMDAAAVDRERRGRHAATGQRSELREGREEACPRARFRKGSGDEPPGGAGGRRGFGIAPDDLVAASVVLEGGEQPGRWRGGVEPCHHRDGPLIEAFLRQHERLEPGAHRERGAVGPEREAAQSAGRLRGRPAPRDLGDRVAGQVVLEPHPLVEPLHDLRLRRALEEPDRPRHRLGRRLGRVLDRRSLRCLDPLGVPLDGERRVDPHVVGQADVPLHAEDLRTRDDRDRMRLRPRAASLEAVGHLLGETLEARREGALRRRGHRPSRSGSRGIDQHEVERIDRAARDLRLDREGLAFEHLDVTGRSQLQPGRRRDVGRGVAEPRERHREAVAERRVEERDRGDEAGDPARGAAERPPRHDPTGTKLAHPFGRLREEPVDESRAGGSAGRASAPREVDDREQPVVHAAEHALDPQGDGVE